MQKKGENQSKPKNKKKSNQPIKNNPKDEK